MFERQMSRSVPREKNLLLMCQIFSRALEICLQLDNLFLLVLKAFLTFPNFDH